MSEQEYLEAVKKAAEEGRIVDIGKVIAQMKRKDVEYKGTDLGDFPINVFVGGTQGALRIGSYELTVSIDVAKTVMRVLGTPAT
jgi:hypothetical protein